MRYVEEKSSKGELISKEELDVIKKEVEKPSRTSFLTPLVFFDIYANRLRVNSPTSPLPLLHPSLNLRQTPQLQHLHTR
jgi:hypothetical protein